MRLRTRLNTRTIHQSSRCPAGGRGFYYVVLDAAAAEAGLIQYGSRAAAAAGA